MARTRNNTKILNTIIDLFEIFFISSGVFVATYFLVGQLLEVTGESMVPTFQDKEQLIAEKISMNFKDVERGEIMIFKHPEQEQKLIIKRVIGLPGESLKIENGQIYINEELLDEPYLDENTVTKGKLYLGEGVEFKVPADTYILLGDNREKSTDSRVWGPINEDLLLGRALFVYYPLDQMRVIQK